MLTRGAHGTTIGKLLTAFGLGAHMSHGFAPEEFSSVRRQDVLPADSIGYNEFNCEDCNCGPASNAEYVGSVVLEQVMTTATDVTASAESLGTALTFTTPPVEYPRELLELAA
jgi:hypothetical protein